jgi:hypothetical protein
MMASDDLILDLCRRVVAAWLEAPMEMENSVMGTKYKGYLLMSKQGQDAE